MFNFKELQLNRRQDDSTDPFVGIRKIDNKLEFRLPIGFEDFPNNDFSETKKLFFRMYRTFKKFSNDREKHWEDTKPKAKDSIETSRNAYRFKDRNDESVTIYSKISMLENMLDAYRELSINTIENQYIFTEEINFSRIDLYLHKAIFDLDNDTFYIDQVHQHRKLLIYGISELIELFCFIIFEIKKELEEEKELDANVIEKYKIFKDRNLSYDQSLFNEDTFDETTRILKDILNHIDKETVYKGNDYWVLYESIENFLYGELDMEDIHEDGTFWGISNFYQIWEDMCNTYMFNTYDDIIYADTIQSIAKPHILRKKGNMKKIGCHSIYCKNDFISPFFISIGAKKEQKKYIRPDLICKNNNNIFNNKIDIETLTSPNYEKLEFSLDFEVTLKIQHSKNIYKKFIKKIKEKHRLFVENLKNSNAEFFNDIQGDEKILKILELNTENNYPIFKVNFRGYPNTCLNKAKKEILMEYDRINYYKYILKDWKYCRTEDILKNKTDIIKQLLYEYCLKSYRGNKKTLENQFIIPHWYKNEDHIGEEINRKNLPDEFNKNNISIFRWNLQKIQGVYLDNDK